MKSFIQGLWADEILKKITEQTAVSRHLMGAPYPTNHPIVSPQEWFFVKMDPMMEAFFVAVALEHGTHLEPTFGAERSRLANELTIVLSEHPSAAFVMREVRKNYRELGGRDVDVNANWFYTKIADAYLDWLYSQPESMALMPEALEKLKNGDGRPRVTMDGVYGFRVLKL